MTPACKREFHKFLDDYWPLWKAHEGDALYHRLAVAFEAGWKQGRQSVHKQRAAMQRRFAK